MMSLAVRQRAGGAYEEDRARQGEEARGHRRLLDRLALVVREVRRGEQVHHQPHLPPKSDTPRQCSSGKDARILYIYLEVEDQGL